MQHSLANCYKQMVAKAADAAADKDMTGIEKINQTRQDIADHLSTFANDIECSLISFATGGIDILRAEESAIGFLQVDQNRTASVSGSLQSFSRDRWSGRHGLQAALIAAGAQGSFFINANMADVACTSIAPAMDPAIGNYSGSNPGPYFDEDKVIDA